MPLAEREVYDLPSFPIVRLPRGSGTMAGMKKLIYFAIGIVCVLLLIGLMIVIGSGLFVRQVANRIVVNPQSATAAMDKAIEITLADGSREQKIQTMVALQKLGLGGMKYVPMLRKASRDRDPEVSRTATETILLIDPAASDDGDVEASP